MKEVLSNHGTLKDGVGTLCELKTFMAATGNIEMECLFRFCHTDSWSICINSGDVRDLHRLENCLCQ